MVALATLWLIAASQSGNCLELLTDRRAGEPVASRDVRDAACPEKGGAAALRYDPEISANVAARDLHAGDVIATAHLGALPAILQGQRLTLASRSGSVTIERPVTALQSARPTDRMIFVRTDDGEVLAAKVQGEGGSSQ